MKRHSKKALAIACMLCTGGTVQAQGLDGALSRVRGQVQQNVQTQVQQRVQARVQGQVQANVQSQVQQRIQANVANGVQARVGNQIEVAAQTAAGLAARAQAQAHATADRASRSNVGANTDVQVNVNANADVGGSQSRTSAGFASSTRASASPIQISVAEVQAYDSVFGQFNPLRTSAVLNTAAAVRQNTTGQTTNAFSSNEAQPSSPDMTSRPSESPSAPEAGSPETPDAGIAGSTFGGAFSQVAQGQAGASNRQSVRGTGQATGNFGVAGVLASNVDFSSMIAVAARQRQAEIAEMRDQALVSANAELLAQADAMEARLNAFASAQQAATASTQTKIQSFQANAANQVGSAARLNVNGSAQGQATANGVGQAEASAASKARLNGSIR
ncbi:hypothetical protein [Rhodopirellula sp. P2]|uniref:hypothetical protein n=1 Tax=Rhodopirellula sp. P2 TaxID=2127060 RepID=UPI0023685D84|nr:hypothetical protein [Rhodopirellula sp. P2]WDQ17280.1 hypothetical protein PSR62_01690 [Rhodopirellula sp. P2]